MYRNPFFSEKPWECPELSGRGRLPMRSPLLPYPSAELALAAAVAGPALEGTGPSETAATPWQLGLDGIWRFALAENPEATPVGFAEPGFDDAAWDELRVPGTWTLQGFDKPHYTNVLMPFGNVPPSTPAAHNPTGLYRLGFVLPAAWLGRRVLLHIGGAESFLEAYCNGSPLGFSKDTRLPAEFELTPHLAEGSNLLAFRVIRYSDASFIEDQDQWWYGGIYRSVYLYSTDFAYLADLDLRPGLDANRTRGSLQVAVKLGFGFDPGAERTRPGAAASDYPATGLPAGAEIAAYRGDYRVRIALHAPVQTAGGGMVPGPRLALVEAAVDSRYGDSAWEARLSIEVDRPLLWSHESPALYCVVASLIAPTGRELEHAACRIGFRRVEIRDRSLLINGARILIKGVNRHEHDERSGKTLATADMVRDIELLKRHNFNAVRLSHYPNDERWYELCDQYGLYLVDEADIESHAYYDQLCRDPRWAPAFLERGMRMALRDKNHPSVIIWSLGNESGYGPNHDALAGWLRSFDPTRPLHYEGAFRPEWGQGWHTLESLKRGRAASDIVSTMYPPLSLLEAWAETTLDDRPFIMCEYSHAMGNSNGGLADYWKTIESHQGLQGGFIWDWVDQGIEAHDARGRKYWKYGGDFGDEPSDLDFICNGLVFPDRSPKPVLAECAKLFQDLRLSSEHPLTGRIRVENRFAFSRLGALRLRWSIQVEGETIAGGETSLPDIGSGESAELALDYLLGEEEKLRLGSTEAFLLLEVLLAESCPWAPAGHRLAWEQLPLNSARTSAPRFTGRRAAAGVFEVEKTAGRVRLRSVAGRPYEVGFSAEGFLCSLSCRAAEFLADPLVMNLWRVPTENDGLKTFVEHRGKPGFTFYYQNKVMYEWLDAGLDELGFSLADRRLDREEATLEFVHEVQSRTGQRVGRFVQNWHFEEEGPAASFLFDLDPALPELPRVGLACALSPGFEGAVWYGRGPQECYSDRKTGAAFGRYSASVDELRVPYVLPQENGNRTELRWLELSRSVDGASLRISGSSFDFSATHYEPAQVWAARHECELVRRPKVYLNLDVAQRGLGTATCGPDTLERYRLRPAPYAFELSFRAG